MSGNSIESPSQKEGTVALVKRHEGVFCGLACDDEDAVLRNEEGKDDVERTKGKRKSNSKRKDSQGMKKNDRNGPGSRGQSDTIADDSFFRTSRQNKDKDVIPKRHSKNPLLVVRREEKRSIQTKKRIHLGKRQKLKERC